MIMEKTQEYKQKILEFIEIQKEILEDIENQNTLSLKKKQVPPPPPPKPTNEEVFEEENDFSFDGADEEENYAFEEKLAEEQNFAFDNIEEEANQEEELNQENDFENTTEEKSFEENNTKQDFDENFSSFIKVDMRELDKVKKVLKKKFKVRKQEIEPLAKQLVAMDSQTFKDFLSYANTGVMKNLQVRQYFLFDLVQKHNMEILSAYLMISGLRKNFDKYEKILKEKTGGSYGNY